jgi:hypothetical protein
MYEVLFETSGELSPEHFLLHSPINQINQSTRQPASHHTTEVLADASSQYSSISSTQAIELLG